MKCPHCGIGELNFEKGDSGTRWEPPTPSSVYCPECGILDFEVEKYFVFEPEDILRKLGYWEDDMTRERTLSLLDKIVYKNTNCGCAFSFKEDENSITITPYVEGFDGELEGCVLKFPFTMEDWSEALEDTDEKGCRVWDCINEHGDDCDCYMW